MGVFGLQFAASFGKSSFVSAGDDQITSFCGQRTGYGQTDSTAGPGDEGDFATKTLGILLYARRQWRLIPPIGAKQRDCTLQFRPQVHIAKPQSFKS